MYLLLSTSFDSLSDAVALCRFALVALAGRSL